MIPQLLIITDFCIEMIKKNNIKKAKHGAGACRSMVYVYYDEFKVIF
jgi:hypothetical protein